MVLSIILSVPRLKEVSEVQTVALQTDTPIDILEVRAKEFPNNVMLYIDKF
jgi:hypothetical protein